MTNEELQELLKFLEEEVTEKKSIIKDRHEYLKKCISTNFNNVSMTMREICYENGCIDTYNKIIGYVSAYIKEG